MVEIGSLALTVIAINAFTLYLTTKLVGIGKIRGGALSGWISSFVGFYVLVNQDKIPTFGFEKSGLIFGYGIIAILSILIVFVGRDKPSNYNIPLLGDLLYYVPRVGIFMGIVIAMLSQTLA